MSSANCFKRAFAVLACIVLPVSCSLHTPPVVQPAARQSGPIKIALFPIENLSRQNAPEQDIRRAMLQRLTEAGAPVLLSEDLERFMERHRVRYAGGIDAETARALREEAGVNAVVITSLEQYVASDPPVIALTQRLVSTENAIPTILWMDNVALTGQDSPGLLGLGAIHTMAQLQDKALDRLHASLAAFLAGDRTAAASKGTGRYAPQMVFQSSFLIPKKRYSVAVTPFVNKCDRYLADQIVMLHFTQELANSGIFNVVEPGVVRDQLLHYRMIVKEGASLVDADIIQNSVESDLIVTGKVQKFNEAAWPLVPEVEFEVLVLEKKRKKVVWASWGLSRGDVGVYFFDWHKIETAEMLASKMSGAIVRSIASEGTITDPRILQELSRSAPSWALLEPASPVQK